MKRRTAKTIAGLALCLAAGGALAGCTYDYLKRSDRVGFSAGDAVRANLERETADPSKASSNDVSGLGGNGVVVAP